MKCHRSQGRLGGKICQLRQQLTDGDEHSREGGHPCSVSTLFIWSGSILGVLLLAYVVLIWRARYLPTNYYYGQPQFESGDPAGAPLNVVGQWGSTVNGVRCRIRCLNTQLAQTEALLATLEFENTTDDPITLTGHGASPWGGDWVVDDRWDLPNLNTRGQVFKFRTTLPAHGSMEMNRDILEVGPIPPGSHHLSAMTSLNGADAKAAPLVVQVKECDWGPVSNGMRLHLRLYSGRPWIKESTVQAGDEFSLESFFQDVQGSPINWWYVDTDHPRIERSGDLITLTYRPFVDQHAVVIEPGYFQPESMPAPAEAAVAGTYRLKVVIATPDTSPPGPHRWTGRLESNVIRVQFTAPAISP